MYDIIIASFLMLGTGKIDIWNYRVVLKQGSPKITLRKTFEGDVKKMELTWGTAENKAKERKSCRQGSSCIIPNG